MLLVAVILAAAIAVLGIILVGAGGSEGAVPWSRLGTRDVHAVRFVDAGSQRLLFGHHDGLLASEDGGRTWSRLPVTQDAMSVAASSDDPIVIAGHHVFEQSLDGGQTWMPIDADLPSLDIHGYTRSPTDASRMWAYLAEGGVYASDDGGEHWIRVFDGHILQITATQAGDTESLVGIDPFAGVVASSDGGRTWRVVSQPPASPVTSLATTPDGRVLVVGGPEGLYRSQDGETWSHVLERGPVLATAVSQDGNVLVAVTDDTLMYRSDDAGVTWPGPGDG